MNALPTAAQALSGPALSGPGAQVWQAGGGRLALPCTCAARHTARHGHDGGEQPPAPQVVSCGTCGSRWCERCHPTHGPRCHFEVDHPDEPVTPLPVGCVVAGPNTRSGPQCSALVVGLALDRGWFPSPYGRHGCARDDARTLADHVTAGDTADTGDTGDEREETVGELAQEAAAWLDEHAAPAGHRVVLDEGLHVVTDQEYDDLYDQG